MRDAVTRFVFAVATMLCSASFSIADWPSFLAGQQGAESATNLPVKWSPDDGGVWTTDLPGHGQSSPIIVDKSIYVTAVDGPMKESNIVICVDLLTGKEKWQHKSESSLQVKNDVYTSRAAPTPVADANGVYAFFESGNLIALDPSGKVRWKRSLFDDYGKYKGRFGLGGSVAQTEDRIFVLADFEGPSYLLAINKATGETIWKMDRESRIAWSSPMVIPVNGKPQIIVSSSGWIDGYDPATGKQLWTTDEVGGNTIASPSFVSDGMFLIGASPGRNGENTEGAKQSNMLMKISFADGKYTPTVVWRNKDATTSFGSPIAHKGHAYYANRAGVLFCIDLETGATAYTMRLAESNWATPLGNGDRVYLFGQLGVTTVVATGKEKNKLAENRIYKSKGKGGPGGFAGEIQYGVALAQEGLVIRTGERLYLIAAK